MSGPFLHKPFRPVPDGPEFCGVCGHKMANAPQYCRGLIADAVAAPEPAQERSSFDLHLPAPISDADHREYRWQNDIVPRLIAAGFESRFIREIKDWQCEPQRRAFEEVKRLCVGTGAIVALIGARGTGKTTIAAQVAKDRAWDENLPPWDQQPPYRKLQKLTEKYRPLYADFGSIEMDELAAARDWFCRLALVVIDEVHERADGKVGERLLTDILDRRYAGRVDTILISNETVGEFNANRSDSVLSRISEHGAIIPCNWKSWRAKG